MNENKQTRDNKKRQQTKVRVKKHGTEILPRKSNINIKEARGLLRGIDTSVHRDKS